MDWSTLVGLVNMFIWPTQVDVLKFYKTDGNVQMIYFNYNQNRFKNNSLNTNVILC